MLNSLPNIGVHPRSSAAACLLLLLPFCVQAAAEESWYVLLLGDQRAGYVRQAETHDGGEITTDTEMHVQVGRGNAVITVSMTGSFVETAEGEPVRAASSMNLGGTPIVTEMQFGGDTIAVTSRQGGRESTQNVPAPRVEWLPPSAMGRYVEAQLGEGAETITVTTIDPAMGLEPFTSTMTIVGEEDVDVFGRTVPATVWNMTVSTMPGLTMREYVDDAGRSLKSTVTLMPGLEMTVLEADKDLALSPLNPPELMASTLVKPTGKKIERPRELRSASYRVGVPGLDYAWPKTSAQQVGLLAEAFVPERLPLEEVAPRLEAGEALPRGQYWRVDVRALPLDAGPDLVHLEFAADEPDEAQIKTMLTSSLALNHEDPMVSALRDEALSKVRTADPNERAEVLRRYVHRTITRKDLSVGFATASEVARTKQGDCTEHAVLLAALLRGAGIPARGVSGLVYVDEFLGHDGVFGYHMWTQAWLDPDGDDGPAPPHWVDLDATLGEGTPFDATHIALVTNDLNGPTPVNDMVQLVPLLGSLQIEVISAEAPR